MRKYWLTEEVDGCAEDKGSASGCAIMPDKEKKQKPGVAGTIDSSSIYESPTRMSVRQQQKWAQEHEGCAPSSSSSSDSEKVHLAKR
mmetsp:Transcript_25933/g.32259  ORF Transcript_25933/g.32259 Transcript_25933/m.32259 type:complete len:87 (-) Transcript_25933:1735-1995(-)